MLHDALRVSFVEDACRQLLGERHVRRCIMDQLWETHAEMRLSFSV